VQIKIRRQPYERKVVIGFIFLVFWVFGHARHQYHIQLEKKTIVGGDDLILERLGGVCQDEDDNFYVLDINAYKVYKFSPQGKQLLAFGRKGEGPGDFLKPYHIAMTEKGEIVVSEALNVISFFDRQGKFITRQNLKQTVGGIVLSLKYAGPDLFYVEKVIPGNQRKQMLVDIKRDRAVENLFTLPDISITINRDGRRATYTVRIHQCTPVILFTHFSGYSAAGFSKDYDILLFDQQGKQIAHLNRDIKPQKATAEEKAGFAAAIQATRLPEDVKKGVIQQLPETDEEDNLLLVKYAYQFN